MENSTQLQQRLKEYYGRIIASTKNLKTSTCCCDGEPASPMIRRIIADLNPEILSRSYGCGSPIPEALEGCTVLDLGCGSGRDVYLLSKLTGENGFVVGVDMTEEQLATAKKHLEAQTRIFGFSKPNIAFRQGYIEDLKSLGIEDESVDVVVSNCVINLSCDKEAVFREIFRVLKPGGELYFSDVFAGRRVPEKFLADPVLHGECLAGAMYIEDFRRLLARLGCPDYRTCERKRISLDNPAAEAKVGMIDFYSLTIRAFKLENLEDICEDYGQTAVYRGTIPGSPNHFSLDDHHCFITGKPMLVCGNTAAMLGESRFASHFIVTGDRGVHYGPFACGPATARENDSGCGGACC